MQREDGGGWGYTWRHVPSIIKLKKHTKSREENNAARLVRTRLESGAFSKMKMRMGCVWLHAKEYTSSYHRSRFSRLRP